MMMSLNLNLLISFFTLLPLSSFASPPLEEFVRKVQLSANYLDGRLKELNCYGLLAGGEVFVPDYPSKYSYFPYPAGPALYHRYNANDPNKNDEYRFIIEPAFQSEFREIISSSVARHFPKVDVEARTGSDNYANYDHVSITHTTNGNLAFNTVVFYFLAPPKELNQLHGLFFSGFPFK